MIFVQTFGDLLAVRSFLGLAEGGYACAGCCGCAAVFFARLIRSARSPLTLATHSFFPGIVFILTFWYRREELGLRIALFYCSSALAGAFGGLIAYGILNMGELWGLSSWRLVFLFEGAPSILFGMLTWFYMPTFPQRAKWLTPAEQAIVVGRVAKQRTVTKKIDMKQLKATLISPKVLAFCMIFLSVGASVLPSRFPLRLRAALTLALWCSLD